MSKEEKYEGNFLESCDLMATPPVTLTVKSVTPKNTERDGRKRLIDKIIIRFEETDKSFICNKTNQRLISAQMGSKPAAWVGRKLTLCVRYVDLTDLLKETDVPAIRVVLPEGIVEPLAARKWMGEEKPSRKGKS